MPLYRLIIILISVALLSACLGSEQPTSLAAPKPQVTLSSISLSNGQWDKPFSPELKQYNIAVGSKISTITLTPEANESGVEISVNGQPVVSGEASNSIALDYGKTTVQVGAFSAEKNMQSTYVFFITRTRSDNAYLQSLSVSGVGNVPDFSKSVFSYDIQVSNSISSVTLKPVSESPDATVYIKGNIVASGSASQSLALAVGANIFSAQVVAEDGVTENYYDINITRAAAATQNPPPTTTPDDPTNPLSDNAYLADLQVSRGVIGPTFSSSTLNYTVNVAFTIDSIRVVADPIASNAGILVNGESATSGQLSQPISLNTGPNTITIDITSPDKTNIVRYTIVVTRALSSDPDLTGLVVSAGELSPTFVQQTYQYTLTLANADSSIQFTPTTSHPDATVNIADTILNSGDTSPAIAIPEGNSSLDVTVTAPNGTNTRVYKFNVFRQYAPNNTELTSLATSAGNLSPAFSTAITYYQASVPKSVDSITITAETKSTEPTLSIGALALTSGITSDPIPLALGVNEIIVNVTAKDGTVMPYQIDVTRQYSHNTSLSDIQLTIGKLKKPVDPTENLHHATVSYFNTGTQVSIYPEESTATMSYNSAPLAAGDWIPLDNLSLGSNTIEIIVTAEDGYTTATHFIEVVRLSSADFAQEAYIKSINGNAYDYFGNAIAVSGNTLAVAALGEDSAATIIDGDDSDNSAAEAGAVYVYTRDNNTWSHQAYIKPSSIAAGDAFGTSLALDGDTLVVGAPEENSGYGKVFIFKRTNGIWSEQASLQPATLSFHYNFGASIAISGDTIVVGTPGDYYDPVLNNKLAFYSGAAYVFVFDGANWIQQAYLKANNPVAYDRYGSSVDIDGDTLVIGAPSEDSATNTINGTELSDCNSTKLNCAELSGAAYVYTRTGANWTQQAYLKSSNNAANKLFGSAVSVSGDKIAVGAPELTFWGTNQRWGFVSVFKRTTGSWSEEAHITPLYTGGTAGNFKFGATLDLQGDKLAIGAPWESAFGMGVNYTVNDYTMDELGSAYLFVYNNSTWSSLFYLKPHSVTWGDRFGSSVAVNSDSVFVGAIYEDSASKEINGPADDIGQNADFGAVYVFK